MPRPQLTSGKDPVPILQEAGWVSGPVWTGAENLAPTGIFFFLIYILLLCCTAFLQWKTIYLGDHSLILHYDSIPGPSRP